MSDTMHVTMKGAKSRRISRFVEGNPKDCDLRLVQAMVCDCLPDTGAAVFFRSADDLARMRAFWPSFDLATQQKKIRVELAPPKPTD